MVMQYYFDTLFPRIPVTVVRQIVANLEKLKLPAKHAGVTGETSRQGSDDIARRPPSVKAALSVSFGQRAPHRASTRDSSPVRRTVASAPERGESDEHRRSSPHIRRSSSRERHDRDRSDHEHRDRERERLNRNRNHEHRDVDRSERDRDRDRDRSHERGDRDRESRRYRHSGRDHGRDHDRSGRDHDGYRHTNSRRSRSRSQSQSHSIIYGTDSDHQPKPFREENKDKTKVVSSNLTKLKDLYGDASERKSEEPADRLRKDSGSEEVIRLGGFTWK